MATGYTHPVREGTITEFKDFALKCARAMGALVMMRDEPLDAPIPDRFERDVYYRNRIASLEAELRNLELLSDEQADREAARVHREAVKAYEEILAEERLTKQRYEAMLAKVEAWECPSLLESLKDFMRKQLVDSIEWDCSRKVPRPLPEKVSGAVWRKERGECLREELGWAKKQWAEEQARADERTAWIRALKGSL